MSMNERRRYSRIDLPMIYRPARLLAARNVARDISCGGIRACTDDDLAIGTRLEIELFLPDGKSMSVDVRVAWVQELSGGDARYEAGLEFLQMDAERVERLDRWLAEHKMP